jgi:hypothetical protein
MYRGSVRCLAWLTVVALAAIGLPGCRTGAKAEGSANHVFSSDSYWNTPLPPDAPVDPGSAAIIRFLMSDNDPEYVILTGLNRPGGAFGRPMYWAKPGDPTYRVRGIGVSLPPELDSLRIPRGAEPDPTADSAMTVFDPGRGYVVGLFRAAFRDGHWHAGGADVFYLRSNGLDGSLPQSDDRRNGGHRGMPQALNGVRLDEIRSGSIRHVLEIFVNQTKCEHVFPMVGDECGTNDPSAPPEGTRIRIRPDIRLSRLHLSPYALIIARCLQTYGAVIGDQSGGQASLKVENTLAEGRGDLWAGHLTPDSLQGIPLADFEVIPLGYGG